MNNLLEPKTKRLLLRQWEESDREPFARMCNDPKVMAFFPRTLNRSESDEIIDSCQQFIKERGWGIWAVTLAETQEFIGIAGLHIPRNDLPPSPCVEILWRLDPKFWGNGYATEAAHAALNVGFNQLNLDEIVAFVVPNNHRSRAVMERLKMTHTGDTFDHPDVPATSSLRQHCLYKITKENHKNF